MQTIPKQFLLLLCFVVTENYTRCFPNPCLNGGECLENVYGVGCNCSAGLDFLYIFSDIYPSHKRLSKFYQAVLHYIIDFLVVIVSKKSFHVIQIPVIMEEHVKIF